MTMHPEIKMYWESTIKSVNGIIDAMEGMTSDEINWRPAPNTSSLYVLATHTMGNVEHSLLRTMCGGPGERDRDSEFVAEGDSSVPLREHWADLQPRIDSALAELTADVLVGSYEFGRLGMISGRELFFRVARHAAEHLGHAEITRDLIAASRT